MTARFFGEYLVQKGVIKPQSLVSALLEQMARMPLVGQLVYDHQWLSADQLLKVFHWQQEKGDDFISACKGLGLWSGELAEKIDEALRSERVPVGQILVSRGDLDLKTLTRSLDDFLAQAEVHPPVRAPETVVTASEAMGIEEEASREVEALLQEVAEETYQPGIIAELEDMFDERKRKAVKVALAFIKDKNPPDSAQISKLMQDTLKIIRTILGLVKIFGLTSLQMILSEMERVVEARMHASGFSLEELQHVSEVVGRAMEEAWVLRDSIARHCTDSMYMKDVEARKRFDSLLMELGEIK